MHHHSLVARLPLLTRARNGDAVACGLIRERAHRCEVTRLLWCGSVIQPRPAALPVVPPLSQRAFLSAAALLRAPLLRFYFRAAIAFFASASMSSALSFGNGRLSPRRLSTFAPLTTTSKQPTRGRFAPLVFTSVRSSSWLVRTVTPGTAALTAFSRTAARVLKAPHVLHASIVTSKPPLPDDAEALAALAGDLPSTAVFALALAVDPLVFLGMLEQNSTAVFAHRSVSKEKPPSMLSL